MNPFSLQHTTPNESVVIPHDLEKETFVQFSNWIDQELEALRERHREFEVPDGNRAYFGR